jgi:integrase
MVKDRITAANERLKNARVRIKIELDGKMLSLRGILPPKPGSTKKKPFQQRIYLKMAANPASIVLAEKEARKVGALLDCKEFEWQTYLTPRSVPATTIGHWLERFAAEKKIQVSATTWETDYLDAFKRLNLEKCLTTEILQRAIEKTEPNTRMRKRLCSAFGQLAQFAGLEADFKPLVGSYSARQVDPRNLPSDKEIVAFYHQIANPGWRWVYGMLATFGLRNHEVFFLDIGSLQQGEEFITVTQGKTHDRQVWAYHPEWIDVFDLCNRVLPSVTGKCHADYGDRVTCYLRARLKMPFRPYDLRHCWAVRVLMFGMRDAIAARQMGHSLAVHNQTYQHWITIRDHQQEHERVKLASDRPVAPTMP